MILHPAIIALMTGSVLSCFMLIYASFFSIAVIREWDLRSGSEIQLILEKRTYLISTVTAYVFGFHIVSLFLFIYTADSLSSLFVGAMCAAGTLNVNSYGYPVFILKLINVIMAGIWLIINYTDNRADDYPLIKKKYILLLSIVPFFAAEIFLQAAYFLNLEADVITSCCGSLFSREGRNAVPLFYTLPAGQVRVLFFSLAAATFASGGYLYVKGKGAYFFSAMSLCLFVLGAWYLVHDVVIYIYELPTHNCPFCIFKNEYAHVGYPFYGALLGGVITGIATGVLQTSSGVKSMARIVPGVQKRLVFMSLLCYGVFFLVSFYNIINSSLKI